MQDKSSQDHAQAVGGASLPAHTQRWLDGLRLARKYWADQCVTLDELVAHARLAQASPYLLKALSDVRDTLELTRRGVDELQDRRIALENIDHALSVVRAAIAKALGPSASDTSSMNDLAREEL